MLEKKKKLSKKQINEDTLVATYYKAVQFFEDYQSKILIGLGVVAVLVVAVILYNNKKTEENLKASALLAKATALYEQSKYQEAVDGDPKTNVTGLKEIVDNYGGTEVGNNAKIFLANSYFFLDKIDDALKYYDDYSGSDPLLKSAALAGEAGCYEAKKEYDKAASAFQDAAHVTKENPSNPEFLLKAGICLINSGKNGEAIELLEKIKEDYPQNSSSQDIERFLAEAKLKQKAS